MALIEWFRGAAGYIKWLTMITGIFLTPIVARLAYEVDVRLGTAKWCYVTVFVSLVGAGLVQAFIWLGLDQPLWLKILISTACLILAVLFFFGVIMFGSAMGWRGVPAGG